MSGVVLVKRQMFDYISRANVASIFQQAKIRRISVFE